MHTPYTCIYISIPDPLCIPVDTRSPFNQALSQSNEASSSQHAGIALRDPRLSSIIDPRVPGRLQRSVLLHPHLPIVSTGDNRKGAFKIPGLCICEHYVGGFAKGSRSSPVRLPLEPPLLPNHGNALDWRSSYYAQHLRTAQSIQRRTALAVGQCS
jgi:hypothetical protein